MLTAHIPAVENSPADIRENLSILMNYFICVSLHLISASVYVVINT